MTRVFRRSVAGGACLMLSGCMTVDQFEQMLPEQRAEYICARDSEVRHLRKEEEDFLARIEDSHMTLDRGYRVHTTCQEVRVETPGELSCTTTRHGQEKHTHCVPTMQVTYEERCVETPVAINLQLEKENLRRYENTVSAARKQRSAVYERCYKDVYRMSAQQAYDYYHQ